MSLIGQFWPLTSLTPTEATPRATTVAIGEGRQQRTIQLPRGDAAVGRPDNQQGLKDHGVGSLAGRSVGVKRQRTRVMLARSYTLKL